MKEHQKAKWKETWRDEYLRWICGFANAQGGVLEIGRNNRGVVVGVPNAARLLEEIPNKVRDILGIMVEVNLRETGGKESIEIFVEPYPSPVSYKGEYHYRSGSTTTVAAAPSRNSKGPHWSAFFSRSAAATGTVFRSRRFRQRIAAPQQSGSLRGRPYRASGWRNPCSKTAAK